MKIKVKQNYLGQQWKTLFLFLFVILCLSSCHHQDRLVGKWECFGDRFKGMQIQISNDGGSFKAEITATTDRVEQEGGFVVGDIKWKEIKKNTENKYEIQNLVKQKKANESGVFTGYYVLTQLEIISDTLLHTRLFVKADEDIGYESNWRKIKDEK